MLRRVKQTFCLHKHATSTKRMIAKQVPSANSMFHKTPVDSSIVNHFHQASILRLEKDEKNAVVCKFIVYCRMPYWSGKNGLLKF